MPNFKNSLLKKQLYTKNFKERDKYKIFYSCNLFESVLQSSGLSKMRKTR